MDITRRQDLGTSPFDYLRISSMTTCLAFLVLLLAALATAADLEIARNWKPGSLKDDGQHAGSEKGFRK